MESLLKQFKGVSVDPNNFNWNKTKAFCDLKEKETQKKYYVHMNASEDVMTLVNLDSKSFGTVCENIIVEIFNLGKRTSTENDGTLNGKKIEIKCARYWGAKDECKWQHLEKDHDYEYVIFVILDFLSFKVWCIKKDLLMGELREKKIVTKQGKQGWWTKKSDILEYLTPIKTIEELKSFVN